MQTLLSVIADPNGSEAGATAQTVPEPFWTVGAVVLCSVGLTILISWRLWYGGFSSLRNVPVRRNRLSSFLPIAVLGVWIFMMAAVNGAVVTVFKNSSESFQEALSYSAMAVLEIGLIVAMLVVAHRTFARRLKGFGLNIRTIPQDAGWALINLLAVYPLILFALWAVLTIGRLMKADFDIQRHQSLTLLAENSGLILRILAVFFAVVIAPLFEEVLFRGFLQSALRSAGANSWAVIVFISVFFAFLHYPNYSHMLALFFLSLGLGYAYEHSGSLFRPILMHVFFNGFSVAVTLLIPA